MIKRHPGLFVGIGGFIIGFILYVVRLLYFDNIWSGIFMIVYWMEWIYWVTYFHGKWVEKRMKK